MRWTITVAESPNSRKNARRPGSWSAAVAARQQAEQAQRIAQRARDQAEKALARIAAQTFEADQVLFREEDLVREIAAFGGKVKGLVPPNVERKLAEVLDVYPTVKGLQIMNDNGSYMFAQYAGKWIPDTPGRRQAIKNTMVTWRPFSDSNPGDGIVAAISTYWSPDKKISLYVLGDDFSSGSIQNVIDTVDRLNSADSSGNRRVRIHTVGFPVQFTGNRLSINAVRYAALMRKLAEDNGGSFVGLNSTRP